MTLFLGSDICAARQPSGRVRLGVIGSGGRGTYVMTVFQKDANLEVAAVSVA
jgi:predicted homoserine dehydrogenase-like protein